MDDQRYATHLAADYDRGAAQYRTDDEIEARSENHQRLGGHLRKVCRSFCHPIRVLEIGCGTGRYFHWLENVKLLVGTDLSAEMLRRARNPVLATEITAHEIRLQQGNVFEMDFPAESFDFIYSLGVFGYGAVWTPAIAEKIYQWLAPGGRVFFNAIEIPHCSSRVERWKHTVKSGLRPVLPAGVKQWLDARQTVPMVPHTRVEIERVMAGAGFDEYVVSSYRCQSPLWNGVHLECNARKTLATASTRSAVTSGEARPPVPVAA